MFSPAFFTLEMADIGNIEALLAKTASLPPLSVLSSSK